MKLVVLYLLTAAAVQVYAWPSGAPSEACDTITPRHTNPSNTASSSNPFSLYLNAFACPTGTAGYCYYPGATYQCKCVVTAASVVIFQLSMNTEAVHSKHFIDFHKWIWTGLWLISLAVDSIITTYHERRIDLCSKGVNQQYLQIELAETVTWSCQVYSVAWRQLQVL